MATESTSNPQLEHELLLRLSYQWQIEAYPLPDGLGRTLKRPQFAFSDRTDCWAYWDRQTRRIVFSRKMLPYPWASFRAVLRHEMGHQLADTCMGGTQQTAHGPAFQSACSFLGAEAAASVDHPGHAELQHISPVDQRSARRIRKLLALAESCNQHEAEAAMVKAHEQIRRHHLDLHTQPEAPDFVSRCLGLPSSRHRRYYYALANLLSDHYYVSAIWIRVALPGRTQAGTQLEISGTADNVELAAYVYDFILLHLERLWNEYRRTHNVFGHRKPDFAIGLIRGFAEKLQKAPSESTSETEALLDLADQRLATYQNRRYPQIRTATRRSRHHAAIANDGHAHGKNLVLQRGIHKHNGTSPHSLPSARK